MKEYRYNDTKNGTTILFTRVPEGGSDVPAGPLILSNAWKISGNNITSIDENGLLYNAIDIDWNGAMVDSTTLLNTTGDLLRWIKDITSNTGSTGSKTQVTYLNNISGSNTLKLGTLTVDGTPYDIYLSTTATNSSGNEISNISYIDQTSGSNRETLGTINYTKSDGTTGLFSIYGYKGGEGGSASITTSYSNQAGNSNISNLIGILTIGDKSFNFFQRDTTIGNKVNYTPTITSGTKLGTLKVDDNETDIYAPSISGGSTVTYTPTTLTGNEIGTLSINGISTKLYSPKGSGEKGDDGLSAYEIAVRNGYTGTEEQWLNSLKGDDGAKGDTGAKGETGARGTDGKSAYELAQDNGYTGSISEWLASLKGEKGDKGDPGTGGGSGGSDYDDTELRSAILDINSALGNLETTVNGFRNWSETEINNLINRGLSDWDFGESLTPDEIFNLDGWDEKLQAYIKMIAFKSSDEDEGLTISSIIQKLNSIESMVENIKIVDGEGNEVTFELLVASVKSAVETDIDGYKTAVSQLLTAFNKFTTDEDGDFKKLSSAFSSFLTTASELLATLSALANSKMSKEEVDEEIGIKLTDYIATAGLATKTYVGDTVAAATNDLVAESTMKTYVDGKETSLYNAISGLASTTYVGEEISRATASLVNETTMANYVDGQIQTAKSGLATESYVDGKITEAKTEILNEVVVLDDVEGIITLARSGLISESEVNSKITTAKSEIFSEIDGEYAKVEAVVTKDSNNVIDSAVYINADRIILGRDENGKHLYNITDDVLFDISDTFLVGKTTSVDNVIFKCKDFETTAEDLFVVGNSSRYNSISRFYTNNFSINGGQVNFDCTSFNVSGNSTFNDAVYLKDFLSFDDWTIEEYTNKSLNIVSEGNDLNIGNTNNIVDSVKFNLSDGFYVGSDGHFVDNIDFRAGNFNVYSSSAYPATINFGTNSLPVLYLNIYSNNGINLGNISIKNDSDIFDITSDGVKFNVGDTFLVGRSNSHVDNIYFNTASFLVNSPSDISGNVSFYTSRFDSSANLTTTSDERLKNIISYPEASIEDIADVRIVDFTYKGQSKVNLGSIALDWLDIYPNAVSANEQNYLGLDYSSVALASAVTAAREIVKLKEENTSLKERISKLESKMEALVDALN